MTKHEIRMTNPPGGAASTSGPFRCDSGETSTSQVEFGLRHSGLIRHSPGAPGFDIRHSSNVTPRSADDDPLVTRSELQSLRDRHRTMLFISIGVIALAGMLVVRSNEKVAFWFLPDVPAPESCISRSWFGIPCPGCGLTRSFVSLAHFDLAASWRFHRLGWLLAAVTVGQIPYRLWAMRHPTGLPLGKRWPNAVATMLIAALVVNWLIGWFLE